MPIIAFNFDKISAKKNGVPKGRVDIKSGPTILGVKKIEAGIKTKHDSLAIDFEFKTTYEPKLAEISIQGRVVYIGDDVKKGLKMWKKDKKLPEGIEIDVRNFIFRKCLGLGITLSENMNLPPPLHFPVFSKKTRRKITDQDLSYIG
jgi:hypothetical protein